MWSWCRSSRRRLPPANSGQRRESGHHAGAATAPACSRSASRLGGAPDRRAHSRLNWEEGPSKKRTVTRRTRRTRRTPRTIRSAEILSNIAGRKRRNKNTVHDVADPACLLTPLRALRVLRDLRVLRVAVLLRALRARNSDAVVSSGSHSPRRPRRGSHERRPAPDFPDRAWVCDPMSPQFRSI